MTREGVEDSQQSFGDVSERLISHYGFQEENQEEGNREPILITLHLENPGKGCYKSELI